MRETKSNDAIIIADEKGYKVLDDGSVVAPSGKILSLAKNKHGYLHFGITDAGESYNVMVHKLAAFQRFGGIIFDEEYEVRHLERGNSDNSLGNVSFGSHSENMMDISAVVRMHSSYASTLVTRKLSVAQVRELRQLREEGLSIRQLCQKYNLAVSTVSYIVNRKTYKDI